jgi:hypothetical protein
MATATKTQKPADQRWGYRFGCDGIVPSDEARTLLGGVCDRTLRRYRSRNLIRVGYRQPGNPASGVVVCRRSLMDYLASCEK